MKKALSIRFRIRQVVQKQKMDSPIIHLAKTKKIDNFIYVSPTASYQTKDEGKTWYKYHAINEEPHRAGKAMTIIVVPESCLKKFFCKMCVTICGRFSPG